MSISNERAEVLSKYLAADEARLAALQTLSAAEAVVKINADGYDFTAEELVAFEAEMNKMAAQQDGELGEDDLDAVAGGSVVRHAWWIGYWVGREKAWRIKNWG